MDTRTRTRKTPLKTGGIYLINESVLTLKEPIRGIVTDSLEESLLTLAEVL